MLVMKCVSILISVAANGNRHKEKQNISTPSKRGKLNRSTLRRKIQIQEWEIPCLHQKSPHSLPAPAKATIFHFNSGFPNAQKINLKTRQQKCWRVLFFNS